MKNEMGVNVLSPHCSYILEDEAEWLLLKRLLTPALVNSARELIEASKDAESHILSWTHLDFRGQCDISRWSQRCFRACERKPRANSPVLFLKKQPDKN